MLIVKGIQVAYSNGSGSESGEVGGAQEEVDSGRHKHHLILLDGLHRAS